MDPSKYQRIHVDVEEFKKLGLKEIYPTSSTKRPIEEIKRTCVSDLRRAVNKIVI